MARVILSSERLLTTQEVAELFDVNVSTVQKWVLAKKITPIGGTYYAYRFQVAEIERALNTPGFCRSRHAVE